MDEEIEKIGDRVEKRGLDGLIFYGENPGLKMKEVIFDFYKKEI